MKALRWDQKNNRAKAKIPQKPRSTLVRVRFGHGVSVTKQNCFTVDIESYLGNRETKNPRNIARYFPKLRTGGNLMATAKSVNSCGREKNSHLAGKIARTIHRPRIGNKTDAIRKYHKLSEGYS
jgi:hypothetical protein